MRAKYEKQICQAHFYINRIQKKTRPCSVPCKREQIFKVRLLINCSSLLSIVFRALFGSCSVAGQAEPGQLYLCACLISHNARTEELNGMYLWTRRRGWLDSTATAKSLLRLSFGFPSGPEFIHVIKAIAAKAIIAVSNAFIYKNVLHSIRIRVNLTQAWLKLLLANRQDRNSSRDWPEE